MSNEQAVRYEPILTCEEFIARCTGTSEQDIMHVTERQALALRSLQPGKLPMVFNTWCMVQLAMHSAERHLVDGLPVVRQEPVYVAVPDETAKSSEPDDCKAYLRRTRDERRASMLTQKVARLAPELIASVLDELEAFDPTVMDLEDRLCDIAADGGMSLAAANAVRRCFQRCGWTSAWPLIEHMLAFFAPLADRELLARATAVIGEARERRRPTDREKVEDPDAFEDWTADHPSPLANCFVEVSNLAWMNTNGCEGDAEEIGAQCTEITYWIGHLLATTINRGAAREFVKIIEMLGMSEGG